MKKIYSGLLILAATLVNISNSGNLSSQETAPPFIKYINHPWVDSVVKSLSLEEKIAQSIWVATWTNRDIGHYIEINRQVETLGIGGLVFFQGTAEKQAELINQYQRVAKVPLSIAMDCEWGPGMRLDGIADFPFQMTLGAIQNDSLIYSMGVLIGEQLKRLGITVNLAPVADINSNPSNPVINYRSFGENKENVSRKSVMYSSGLQSAGIIATGKHFPGHGDTDTDSHFDLPLLKHPKERFDSLELYPFRALIDNGVGAIMTAHLNIPSLGTNENQPSTLSPEVIKGVLREELGFKGLIVSDAMNMKGLTNFYPPGVADAMAYIAGNDILEYVNDPVVSIKAIKEAVNNGRITIEEVDERCRRIIAMKYWSQEQGRGTVEPEGIDNELNNPSTLALIRELYANSLTLLSNRNNTIPVKNLAKKKIATLAINRSELTPFQKMVSNYVAADHFFWVEGETKGADLIKSLSEYDLVISAVYGTDQRPAKRFGITDQMELFLADIEKVSGSVMVYFGNPYALNELKESDNFDALLLSYQENTFTEELSAQLIFGGIGAHGKLPVTINEKYKSGFGLITPGNLRLQYGYPESAGVSSQLLNTRIDSLAEAGLRAGAYPGCEIIAAIDGIVVFHKSYGFHTFDMRQSVEPGDIWDLASVTKVSGALSGLMKLEDMGLFSTENTLSAYWPSFKRTDKGDLRMDEILAHQSGLAAWIPFWKNGFKEDNRYRARSFTNQESKKYQIPVAEGIFLYNKYKNKIYRDIKKSPLGEKKYLYSGLTFYLFPGIIENLSGIRYEDFIKDNIFKPIGANNIVFNPYKYFPGSRIVPTELDTLFRNQLIHGYVHDEGAAMMGGVSGNAGLFSSANDLIKLIEMYRRMGSYGGETILSEEVMKKYSTAMFLDNDNRRGLGFDKPQLPYMVKNIKEIYPCQGASVESFGHSGYTGTFVWADPVHKVSYVFLSNRVYPTRDNNLISDMNIRTEILQGIYDAIKGS